ncbi:hypothetical protein BDR07DRAFT_1428572, partial [Suillus spraguei]
MNYLGSVVNRSAHVCMGALGGQTVCSADVICEIYVGLFDSGTHSMYQPTQATRRSGRLL